MTAGDERRDHPLDSGMSIVEVLVAVALFTVLTTMIASMAIMSLRISTGMQVRLDNSVQGNLGMAATSKVLRTAVLPDQLEANACDGCADTAVVEATSTRVKFYANLNNTGQGPSQVTIEVLRDPSASEAGAVLRQSVQPPRPLGGGKYTFCDPEVDQTCHVEIRSLARGLLWPTQQPVFTYYDFDGLRIDRSDLTSAELPRISSVDVSFTVQTRPGHAVTPTATTIQRVRLPNADINVLVEGS
jgi:hypothetical protein